MCNLSAGVEAKGIEKGIEKGIKQERLSSLRKMMKNMHISAEEAMTVLEIPENEKSTYMELLETI